jgi:hypothetical protein
VRHEGIRFLRAHQVRQGARHETQLHPLQAEPQLCRGIRCHALSRLLEQADALDHPLGITGIRQQELPLDRLGNAKD